MHPCRVRCSLNYLTKPSVIDLSAAPSSPPVNITVSVINSTAFNSKWRIPEEDELNGAPEFVEIRLIGKDIKTKTEITIPISTNETSSKSIILSPLQEYVLYSVSFAVRNGVGISAFSEPLYLRTNPAGKISFIGIFYDSCIHVFSNS